MIDVQGKRVLVVGLARSGRAAARILQRKGAVVTVTDSRPPANFQVEIAELTSLKIGLELGLHREETFLRQDLIVVSPGVPGDMPQLVAARQKKISIVPEIEVASWFLEGLLLGVTGSNGKTTTTSLLGRMLEASGFPTFVGGNIGVPLISAVEQARSGSMLVAELSSFQLETIQSFHPRVAVLLNLSPNHLDRHHSFEAYVGAKARIFHNQTVEDYAILNADDPNVMSLAPAIASQKIFFSRRANLPDGVFVSNGQIVYRVGNLERVLLETSDVRLRGDFNVEDVLAASAAACVMGADFDAMRQSVREFKGVEHRLEYVRKIHQVEFYNDSKATSVDATAKALTAFSHGVHLILGGKDKGAPYTPLRPLLKDRVREVLVIGSGAEKIASDLDGAVEIIRAGDLETAVRRAFGAAVPGDTVLLAPACASYDQFQDFEQRGQVFKDLVERLSKETAIADTFSEVEIVTPEPVVAADNPWASNESEAEPELEAKLDIQAQTGLELEIAAVKLGRLAAAAREQTPRPAEIEMLVASTATSGAELKTGPMPPTALPRPTQELSSPPNPETRNPNPDFVYVYEVAAEEVSPMLDELPPISFGSESEPLAAGELSAPETTADEALPYEVPAETAFMSAGDGAANDAAAIGLFIQTETEGVAPPQEKMSLSPVNKEQASLFESSKVSEKTPGA